MTDYILILDALDDNVASFGGLPEPGSPAESIALQITRQQWERLKNPSRLHVKAEPA